MLVSPSQYAHALPSQKPDETSPQLDPVSLQVSKIHKEVSTDASLRYHHIRYIQKMLISLNDSPKLFNLLARAHYISFYFTKGLPDTESFTCQDSTFAMIQLNIFKQRFYREIDNLIMFEQELQDNEEGTFAVRLPGSPFANDSEETIFQGHDFVIYKIRENQKNSYLIAQSFVDQYSLKSFILKNKMIYDNYDQLKKAVLDPVYTLINKYGKWTEKECQAYCDLTSIYPD